MSSAVYPAYDYCLIEKQAEKRDYKQLECEQPLGMKSCEWVNRARPTLKKMAGKNASLFLALSLSLEFPPQLNWPKSF